MRFRTDEAQTEELSWNSWVGRRPDEMGPASYPISAETAEARKPVGRISRALRRRAQAAPEVDLRPGP